jgi:thymidine phosphorylase
VTAGERLATIYYNSGAKLPDATPRIAESFQVSDQQPPAKKLIRRLVEA